MAASPKITRTIKNLIRLSTSPNEHEAARASEEAERLMAKHGLTLADFEEDVVEVADDHRDDLRQRLARAVGASRRCAAIANKRGEVAFRGRAEAARNAREAYRALVREVSANCEIGPRDPGRQVWRICYWMGFVEAVCDRLLDDEVRSWTRPAKTSEGAEAAATAVGSAPDVAPVPSAREEQAAAIKDFAGFFLPEDVRRAIQVLCNQAYDGGKWLGQNVKIVEWSRDALDARAALAAKSAEQS